MHLIEMRAEIAYDSLVVVGPVAEGCDILFDLHAGTDLLL